MNTLRLRHDYEESAVQLRGEFTDARDVDETLDSDTIVLSPDGKLEALLLCGVIPRDEHLLAYELWKNVRQRCQQQAGCRAGAEAMHRSRSITGELSPRTGTNERVVEVLRKQGVRQGIIGYLDGNPCRKTPLTAKHPEMLNGNRTLIELVDELYQQHVPELHAFQKAEVKKVPRWRLWHTAFSTVYVIKQLKTASYHRELGQFARRHDGNNAAGEFYRRCACSSALADRHRLQAG